MSNKIMTASTSVRIRVDDVKVFGPGVAELLRRVKELHSLRAAAASMAMAYSKAWTVIRAAEGCLGYKLLISTTGGKHGGGATVSPEAETRVSHSALPTSTSSHISAHTVRSPA